MSTCSHDRDPDELRFSIRRIDQRWHLTATGGGLEHTHYLGFDDKREAYDFRDQVRAAYERGRDLNLVHWDTVPVGRGLRPSFPGSGTLPSQPILSRTPRVFSRRFPETVPAGAIYVGRPSPWGNPYVIGRDGDRSTVIRKYERYILGKIEQGRKAPEGLDLAELKGKDLVCWCAPRPCHADILLKLANENGGS